MLRLFTSFRENEIVVLIWVVLKVCSLKFLDLPIWFSMSSSFFRFSCYFPYPVQDFCWEGFLFTQQSDSCTKKWHLVHTLHYHQGSCRALKILNQPNKDSSGYKIWLHHWCWRYKIIQAIYNSLMETLIIPVRQIICNETRATTVYNNSRLKGSSMVNSPFKANFKYGITMFLVSLCLYVTIG